MSLVSAELPLSRSATESVRPDCLSALRIPALDGLRGMAVLLVMVFHFFHDMPAGSATDRAALALARGGWCGVDLFFVLSGFLITGILLDAKGGPRYFISFYGRRTLRIFPLYYLTLFVLLVLLPLVYLPADPRFEESRRSQVWLWTYLVNWHMAFRGEIVGYGTGHFWSLAVEEQFYLIWPAVVWLLSRRQLAVACAVMIALAFALRIAMLQLGAGPIAAFVLTPARFDTLAAGALVAALWRDPACGMEFLRRFARWSLPVCALGLLVLAAWRNGVAWERPIPMSLGYSLLAIGSAATLALALSRDTLIATFFDRPWLRVCGTYAYALYVFHPIVLGFVRLRFPPSAVPTVAGLSLPGHLVRALLCFAVTLAAAYASWHLIEKRFLKLKRFFAYG